MTKELLTLNPAIDDNVKESVMVTDRIGCFHLTNNQVVVVGMLAPKEDDVEQANVAVHGPVASYQHIGFRTELKKFHGLTMEETEQVLLDTIAGKYTGETEDAAE